MDQRLCKCMVSHLNRALACCCPSFSLWAPNQLPVSHFTESTPNFDHFLQASYSSLYSASDITSTEPRERLLGQTPSVSSTPPDQQPHSYLLPETVEEGCPSAPPQRQPSTRAPQLKTPHLLRDLMPSFIRLPLPNLPLLSDLPPTIHKCLKFSHYKTNEQKNLIYSPRCDSLSPLS